MVRVGGDRVKMEGDDKSGRRSGKDGTRWGKGGMRMGKDGTRWGKGERR